MRKFIAGSHISTQKQAQLPLSCQDILTWEGEAAGYRRFLYQKKGGGGQSNNNHGVSFWIILKKDVQIVLPA